MRKYLDDCGGPRARARPRRAQPVLEEVRGRIDEILPEWSKRPTGKQRIAGALVHGQTGAGGVLGGQYDRARLLD